MNENELMINEIKITIDHIKLLENKITDNKTKKEIKDRIKKHDEKYTLEDRDIYMLTSFLRSALISTIGVQKVESILNGPNVNETLIAECGITLRDLYIPNIDIVHKMKNNTRTRKI